MNNEMSGELINGLMAQASRKFCRNCNQPIKPITDPWGCTSHQGKAYGFFHPHLVDRREGNVSKAEWCDESELIDDSHDVIAEPHPAPTEMFSPGISKSDYDAWALRSE